jgi:hypothetical protein
MLVKIRDLWSHTVLYPLMIPNAGTAIEDRPAIVICGHQVLGA